MPLVEFLAFFADRPYWKDALLDRSCAFNKLIMIDDIFIIDKDEDGYINQ